MKNRITTIWSQLDAWATGFRPWQRFVLANAVRLRRLKDEQIDQAYRLFLQDNDLGDACDPPIDVPLTITGRPASVVPTPIRLTRISDLRAINALLPGAELNFSPALTVVYGRNGTGKSGFKRILSNVCFSRTQHPILPNVYGDESMDKPSARIELSDGALRGTSFVFDGSNEHPELKRIAVFDTDSVRSHLVEQRPLGFEPAGFDVFPEMARVYKEIAKRLTADIEARSRTNTFINSFVAPESSVSQFVAALTSDTNVVELCRIAVFGETEIARLKEVQRQIQDLKSKSVTERVEQLENAKRDFLVLDRRLIESRFHLTENNRAVYRAQLANFVEKARLATAQGSESFKQGFFNGIGTPEWEHFLAATRALALIEHDDYPSHDDHCLFCHRPLDAGSAALIRRFWAFLASEARREAEEASCQLDQSAQALKTLRLNFFSEDSAVYAHLSRLNPALASRIDELVTAMENDRMSIVTVLDSRVGDIGSVAFEDVDTSLTSLIAHVDADITRLKEEKIEDAIKALDAERIRLRHRQVLKQLLPEAEKYVADLKWARKASGAPQSSLNTRPLTNKENQLFTSVIAEEYRNRFADECRALDFNSPVEFRTKGQRGQTMLSLSIKGEHSPANILSEGEQRAVALADFLTEIALNPANAGVVLDDPVNSQDHQRKKLIARRLVKEAKNRQVITLTHDLVFLTMLAGAANDENVELLMHWIERDREGRPGQVSLDDCPATTPQYRKTGKAKKSLFEAESAVGSARMELVQRGMGELRRTVEEIVPHYLLKQVVNRWTDRIIVTALKRVNWDDSLIKDIVAAHEELSAQIEGHSHTEEQVGAPPEPGDLEKMITRVNDLIKRARPDRAN